MTLGPGTAVAVDHRPSRSVAIRASVVVIAGLVGINLLLHLAGANATLVEVPAAVVLLAVGRRLGLSWHDIGLGRGRLVPGAVWGGCCIAAVAAVYTIGVLVPFTRDAFRDQRYHVGAGSALYTALVLVPFGTVLFEEIAFRGVLWALLARFQSRWYVLGTTSVLFGLWHVLPALHAGSSNAGVGDVVGSGGSAKLAVVLGTVVFTTLGGVVFGELRRRSGCLLASVGLHWATNALGVLFGLWAWSLATS